MLRLRNAGLTWQVVDDEVVVLDLKASSYLQVNGSGAVLWRRLQEPCTEVDLRDLLVERFGIDSEMAREDVQLFLTDLRAQGLLEEVGE